MAHLFYIDDDPVAITALTGIIHRSPHTMEVLSGAEEALHRLSESVACDMLILELKLKNENIWPLIKKIRANPFLAELPILVYTAMKDRRAVSSVLEIGVQNYLFKPFNEHQLLEEIGRAVEHDWRIHMAGNPQLFYSRLKVNVEDFQQANVALLEQMEKQIGQLKACSSAGSVEAQSEAIETLAAESEKQDYTLLKRELMLALEEAKKNAWTKAQVRIAYFDHALTLQRYRMGLIETALHPPEEEEVSIDVPEEEPEPDPDELKQRYSPEEIEEKIRTVNDYPVIESAAAAFQMISNEVDINLDEIVTMIERDPGLATAVLRFSNSPFVAPASVIEDIHQAISVLGLARVRTLAMSLRTVSEVSAIFKAFRWQDFWMHQVGCAFLCEFIFRELELPGRPELAYLGGLLGEMGKILLCDIDPEAYRFAVQEAKEKKRALVYCEREYFGCSHDHAGLLFAKESNLADSLQAAIAYRHRPAEAREYVEFVGAVSLAHYLCIVHRVGESGEAPLAGVDSIGKHPAWDLFSPWMAPNFSIIRFSRVLESKTKSLKNELGGMVQHLK